MCHVIIKSQCGVRTRRAAVAAPWGPGALSAPPAAPRSHLREKLHQTH